MQTAKEKAVELAALLGAIFSSSIRDRIVPSDFTGIECLVAEYIKDPSSKSRIDFDRWLAYRFGIEAKPGTLFADMIMDRLSHNASLNDMTRSGGESKWQATQLRFYEALERRRAMREAKLPKPETDAQPTTQKPEETAQQ